MNAFIALRLQQLIDLYAPLRQRGTLLDGPPPGVVAAAIRTNVPVASSPSKPSITPSCREIAA